MPAAKPLRLGLIPANRGFFSATLAAKMRRQAIDAMGAAGVEVVVPDESQTKVGCVENRAEAETAAALFRQQEVAGIVVIAANFGDEQGAAWAVRQARLDVPVLLFGCQEEAVLRPGADRRDAFCGLLSIGEALRQIGARYSVASRPIGFPADESFRRDVDWFARVCRVVRGVRQARYGQVGARPEAFWTCRFDEKQLQRLGPTTVVLDLSEAIAAANAIDAGDRDLQRVVASIQGWADTSAVSRDAVARSARLELFLRRWARDNALDALAVQCWTSIQRNFGVCSCATMSRFGDEGLPSACEADILGALSMHALLLAGDSPAALADWNNLHNEDDDLVNVWHCGVFPSAFARGPVRLSVHGVLAASGAVPPENAHGVVELVARPSPLTLARVTQDPDGSWKAVIAEGRIEDNPAATFGGYGWCRIPQFQRLYREVLLEHFPHHVAIVQGHVGNVLWEAFGRYLGMQVHHGGQATPGLFTPRLPFNPTALSDRRVAAARL